MTPDEMYAQIEALDAQAAVVRYGPGAGFWERCAELDEQRAALWKQIAESPATLRLPSWAGNAATIAHLKYAKDAHDARREARR